MTLLILLFSLLLMMLLLRCWRLAVQKVHVEVSRSSAWCILAKCRGGRRGRQLGLGGRGPGRGCRGRGYKRVGRGAAMQRGQGVVGRECRQRIGEAWVIEGEQEQGEEEGFCFAFASAYMLSPYKFFFCIPSKKMLPVIFFQSDFMYFDFRR